jgi:ribosomal protein S19
MDEVFVGNLEYEVTQLLEIHSEASKRETKMKSIKKQRNSIKEFSLKSKNTIEEMKESFRHNRDSSLDFNIFPEYLNGTVNILYGKEFAKIILQRKYVLDKIFKSFDQEKNRKNINKTGTIRGGSSGNGGASGEFFFVTYDKKFIIKTISEEEDLIFDSVIEKYTDHVLTDEVSIIARIVGYFVFNLDILDKRIRVIVMENIFKINSKCIRRKYDLKGSTYKRKILRSTDLKKLKYKLDVKKNWMCPKTLKDIDFNRIEHKISLTRERRDELLATIEKDVRFLESVKMIDYSLIIAVINLEDLRTEKFQAESSQIQKQINCLIEKGIFVIDKNFEYGFIIGIIDFFQKYTFAKWFEKYYKIMINLKYDLNTSSQPARVYAQRFLDYMETIFSDDRPTIDLSLNSYET